MGLSDIEKKIIGDAEAEAAQIVTEAKKIQDQRLNESQALIAAERKQQLEQAKATIAKTVEQRKQLYSLTADQEILRCKRDLLDKLITEVQENILGNKEKLEKYYSQILKEALTLGEKVIRIEIAEENKNILQKCLKTFPDAGVKIETKTEPRDLFVIVFARSKINCSLGLSSREKAKMLENKLLAALLQE